MAAPTLTTGYTKKLTTASQTPVAATIKAVTAPLYNRIQYNGWQVARFASSPVVGEKNGGAIAFASIDLSTDDYVIWQHNNEFANGYWQRTTLHILFQDSVGNWSEFIVMDTDSALNTAITNASNYYNRVQVDDTGDRNWIRILDRALTPNDSSGTLDWSDIVRIEMHGQSTSTSTDSGCCGMIGAVGTIKKHVVTAGDVTTPITFATLFDLNTTSPYPYEYYSASPDFDGQNGVTYVAVYGHTIGDGGTTATRFEQSNFNLYLMPQHDSVEYPNYHCFLASGNVRELINVSQGASDYYLLQSGVVSARGTNEYSVTFNGHASATKSIKDVTFWRPKTFTANTFNLDGVVIDGFTDGLVINAATTLVSCTLRNGVTGCRGLVLTGIAGDYSALDVRLNANTTHDIELGSGGAGTYVLTGITKASGYTLKIHNDSATNAITVEIPAAIYAEGAGVGYSTSTAGGSITITAAAVTYTLELPNIIDGSRFQIYNVTTATELTNALTSGGTGIDETYTSGTHYTAGDTGRYRITYQSGTSAKEEIEGTFTFAATTTTNSIPVTQADDSVYASAGIDGSTVTEITWDGINLQLDVDDPDNTMAMQRIGAWYHYFVTTATGIDELLGAFEWPEVNKIVQCVSCVDVTITNADAVNPLKITDGWLSRDDGTSIIDAASPGSIQIDPPAVFAVETGVSGLTTPESDELFKLTTVLADLATVDTVVDAVKAKTDLLTFTGTDVRATLDGEEVTTDAASRTASQADVSALATSAAVAALNDLSQVDVRGAVGLAAANLDTQIGALASSAEIAALNDLSSADVRTELATELASIEATRKLAEADVSFDVDTSTIRILERGTLTDLVPPKAVAGTQQTEDASITE